MKLQITTLLLCFHNIVASLFRLQVDVVIMFS